MSGSKATPASAKKRRSAPIKRETPRCPVLMVRFGDKNVALVNMDSHGSML